MIKEKQHQKLTAARSKSTTEICPKLTPFSKAFIVDFEQLNIS